MKHSISILLAVILVCLFACGSKGDFHTSDLAMYQLSGRVASCKITTYELVINGSDTVRNLASGNTVSYSLDGMLTGLQGQQFIYDAEGNLVPNNLLDSIVRNEKKQIIKMIYAGEYEGGGQDIEHWTYNEQGYPITYAYYGLVVENNKEFTYDKNNIRTGMTCNFYDGDSQSYKQTYNYLQIDKHGNWTKCLEKNDDGTVSLVERKITYYSEDVADNTMSDLHSLGEEGVEPLFEEEIIPITPEPKKYAPFQVVEDESDEQAIFEVVENMPEYPGGQAALMEFIAQNLQYPTVAKEAGTQGRVIVQFVVERDGSITNAKAVRSVPSLDEEAVRIINAMPKWKPGMQRGKPVRVKYTLPVMFRLN